MTDQTQTTTEPVAWLTDDEADEVGTLKFATAMKVYRLSSAARTTPQPLAIGLDREGPGGWLIKDTLNGGWVWTPTRIAAVAALTEGHQIWSVDNSKYENACLPAAPTGETGA